MRYCLYTLLLRCDRVVLPFPLPPRGASPTWDPALNRSGPVRKWIARPVSLFLALGFPATIVDAPRRWRGLEDRARRGHARSAARASPENMRAAMSTRHME